MKKLTFLSILILGYIFTTLGYWCILGLQRIYSFCKLSYIPVKYVIDVYFFSVKWCIKFRTVGVSKKQYRKMIEETIDNTDSLHEAAGELHAMYYLIMTRGKL